MGAVETLISGQTGQVLVVPVARVRSVGNVRRDLGDLDGLAASIVDMGLLQPIDVYPDPDDPDGWVVRSGHRRLAAHIMLGRDTLPAIVAAPPADEVGRLVAQLVENLQRTDLTPYDEACGFAALADLGQSQREIAERVGRHQSHVSRRLPLATLPDDVAAELHEHAVPTEDQARLARLPGDVAEDVLQTWRDLREVEESWRRRSVADLVTAAENRVAMDARRREAERAAAAEYGDLFVPIDDLEDTDWTIASDGWLRQHGTDLDRLAEDRTLRWTVRFGDTVTPVCVDPDRYDRPAPDDPHAAVRDRAIASAPEVRAAVGAQLRDRISRRRKHQPATVALHGLLAGGALTSARFGDALDLYCAGLDDDARSAALDRLDGDRIIAMVAEVTPLATALDRVSQERILRHHPDQALDVLAALVDLPDDLTRWADRMRPAEEAPDA